MSRHNNARPQGLFLAGVNVTRAWLFRKRLTLTPEAVHARHDDGAARPEFLHIGRGAVAHGIGARIVARIDVVRLIARMDTHAGRCAAVCATLGRELRDGGQRRLHAGARRNGAVGRARALRPTSDDERRGERHP